jgi:hypothetical protein
MKETSTLHSFRIRYHSHERQTHDFLASHNTWIGLVCFDVAIENIVTLRLPQGASSSRSANFQGMCFLEKAIGGAMKPKYFAIGF